MLQEQKPVGAGVWQEGWFDRDRKAAREIRSGEKPGAVPQVLTIHR